MNCSYIKTIFYLFNNNNDNVYFFRSENIIHFIIIIYTMIKIQQKKNFGEDVSPQSLSPFFMFFIHTCTKLTHKHKTENTLFPILIKYKYVFIF